MKKSILIAAAAVFSSCLYAQDSARVMLDEVVVTAGKTAQKQSETGKVISVIGREQIEQYQGRSLGALLNDQAGLVVGGALNAPGTNQTPYLRGASTGRTLILIDGVPVYDPSLLYNEFDLNLVALSQIQRIEICRGAQSTLYGSDAVSGVINIITQSGGKEKPIAGALQLGAGNYGSLRTNVEVHGQSRGFSYALQYSLQSTDGFSTAYDSSGKQSFDADGYQAQIWRGSLGYRASDALAFSGFLQQGINRVEGDQGAFADEKDYVLRNRGLMAGAGFRYHKGNVQLAGNYQYNNISRRYVNDSTDIPSFTKYSSDSYYGQTQFAEIYASIGLGAGFTLLQGGDYRYSSMNSRFYSLSSFGPYSSGFRDTAQSQASVYSSLYYRAPSGRWTMEAGGRLNVQSRYGNNSTFTINPSVKLGGNWRVFASVATGYKAPSLYQLYGAYGRLDLKPETSTNYEAGVARSGQTWSGRLTGFYRKIRNGIDFDYINYEYFNFIRQTVWGMEWEGNWKLGQQWDLRVNYSYLHPEEQSQSRIDFSDTVYHYLLRRPQHSVNASLGYRPSKTWFISLSGKYVSERYDVSGYQKADVPLPGYFLLNAHASFEMSRHTGFYADAQNILNRKFFDLYGYNSIPFLFELGCRVNW